MKVGLRTSWQNWPIQLHEPDLELERRTNRFYSLTTWQLPVTTSALANDIRFCSSTVLHFPRKCTFWLPKNVFFYRQLVCVCLQDLIRVISFVFVFNLFWFFFRSTDSQLKLWNISKPHCLRTFKGHINEKNFVGLASNGDYIACGKLASVSSLK